MRTLKQSGVRPVFFLLVLTSDHITGATGLTPTVTISKDGAAFGAPAGTVAEIANGWYKLTPTSADTGTLGALLLHATGTGADPVDHIYQVVAYDPESATNLGLSNLDALISSRMATYTQPTGFLAATFPGSVASPTNITAATGVVLSGVTHTGAVIPTVSVVTGLTASNLDVAVSTRMASYTQPVGFLAATFPGTVGSSTYAGGAVASVTAAVTVGTNNDKTGYALSAAGIQAMWDALTSALTTVGSIGKLLATNIDALISSRSTYAGADTSGTTTLLARVTGLLPLASDYTAARAAKLDNLDATVSSRSTFAGGAVASVTAGVTVTTNNDKTGYALSSAGVQAVWDALTSALTTVGSIGKRLVDNVDALISSRSTYAGGDTSGTTTLLGRLTSGRATNLDNLDAAVSSRSTFAGGAVASVTGAVGSVAAGGIGASSFAVGAIDATVLASSAEQAIADKVMATAVDGTITHKQMMQILGAALAGKASGAGTTTIAFRDVNDTRNCIIATVDAIGDRSAITLALV